MNAKSTNNGSYSKGVIDLLLMAKKEFDDAYSTHVSAINEKAVEQMTPANVKRVIGLSTKLVGLTSVVNSIAPPK